MQSSDPMVTSDSQPSTSQPVSTPLDPANQAAGYRAQHGSGASAQPVSARTVPGTTRMRRAVTHGGKAGTGTGTGARKRLAASALSPGPKVSENSDTAKLQELVLANILKEVIEGFKDVKSALELTQTVKSQEMLLHQHGEAIRILRGTAMEQDNRLTAALVKLNLTVAATDKLDDAVELIEADQAAVMSDFEEFKTDIKQMREIVEAKEVEQDSKLLRLSSNATSTSTASPRKSRARWPSWSRPSSKSRRCFST